MNNKLFLYQIFVHNLAILYSECWAIQARPFTVKFTNVSSYSVVNYVETNSSISSSSGSISLFVNVKQNIHDFYAKVLVTVDTTNGVDDLELINRTVDACEFYRNPKYEPILQIFHRLLTKNGIVPKSCPIRRNLYSLKDVLIETKSLPPIMPYTRLMADIALMAKKGNGFKTFAGCKIHTKIN